MVKRQRANAMPSASPNTLQQSLPNLPLTTTLLALLTAIILGSYLGGKFLFRAWLLSTLSITLIITIALGFHHLVVSHQNQPSNFPRRTFPPLKFSAPTKWPAAVRGLRAQAAFPKEFRDQLVPGMSAISDQLAGLLRLVLRDFVGEWFDEISEDAAFPIAVEKAVRTAIANLRERMFVAVPDPTDTMVRKFLPMFTAHLMDFTNAERAVRGSRVLTESEEVDKIVATRYGALRSAGLHPATALSFSDPTLPQQEWLRALMERVLPLVMPEKEAKSRAVLVLVREIISCAVLYPVMNLLADPDVWNQLIEHMAASAIQDRRKVKKFRDALSQQLDSPSKRTKQKFDAQLKKLIQYNEDETYDSLVQICRTCQILSDVRRLRSDLIILISKVEAHKERLAAEGKSKQKNIDGLLKRLDEIKAVLDDRIVVISGKSIRRRSTLVKPTTRLADLLLSSSGQSYFMEFMDRRGRMRPLQFWLLVNNIKDPLEDADSDPLPQHSSWTQNDIDDLSAIQHGYFSDTALDVDAQLKQDLTAFLANPGEAKVEQYQKARKAILVTQHSVYATMEREDWPLFRKTDLWHKYIAAADSAPTTPAKPPPQPKFAPTSMARSHSTGMLPSRTIGATTPRNESATDLRKLLTKAPPTRIPSGESHASSDEPPSRGDDSPASVPQQSEEEVVNAISAALNDIIKSDAKDDLVSVHSRNSSDLGERPMPGSGRSSIDLSRSTELSPTIEEGRMSDDRRTPSEPQRERVPIFNDDDDYRPDFAIDTLTRTSTEDTRPGLGIHVDVIEELEMVEVDIERLKREIRLTTSMIGKAELTGSYEELRLLKDSRASMERELARKEQLRETYANQDGEHNLTERITIESSGVGHEPGAEFVVYNIIIRQFKSDDTLVSSWSVSRRYSEFYELHRCLRRQFTEVKSIAFPKKSNPIAAAVLKPTRGGFVEGRMASLEKYLQILLLIPGVRECPDVRAFLAPQSMGSPPPGDDRSAMESSVESLSNVTVNGSGSPRKLTTVPEQSGSLDMDVRSTSSKNEYVELTPITIPIFDMMIELFDLHHGNNWPRKALIDAVQRLLGGRIERIVRDQVGKYVVETYIVDIMKQIQDAIWPNGVLQKNRPIRSAKEKAKTKRDAGYKLATIFEGQPPVIEKKLIIDSAGNIMGHANARSGAARLASLCQNTHLNTHFAYTVLDELVATLFPELGHPLEHSLTL